jgi:ketosteroid isomerase-like protein
MDETDALRQASDRFYEAANQVVRGDPAPMMAVWSHGADATYADPRGSIQVGWDALQPYWEEAARLNRSSPLRLSATPADLLVRVQGDLAYTVGIERVRIERGDQVSGFEARATNIYRREGVEWKLIHRHTDPGGGIPFPDSPPT